MVLIERDSKVEKIIKDDLADLVKEATELLVNEDYDKISNYLFQRQLRIDYLTASLVVDKLFHDKVLYNPILSEDEDDNIILTVDKNKLRSFLIN